MRAPSTFYWLLCSKRWAGTHWSNTSGLLRLPKTRGGRRDLTRHGNGGHKPVSLAPLDTTAARCIHSYDRLVVMLSSFRARSCACRRSWGSRPRADKSARCCGEENWMALCLSFTVNALPNRVSWTTFWTIPRCPTLWI